jgi:arylsulfatase
MMAVGGLGLMWSSPAGAGAPGGAAAGASAALAAHNAAVTAATAQDGKKPNILIIWGDDVGMWNLSCYHRGMMGGSTPNIDRIATGGMMFMDHYAQASCTAGRAAFITGQYPIRVGLATVGLPGAEQGLSTKDPTLATLLKPLG